MTDLRDGLLSCHRYQAAQYKMYLKCMTAGSDNSTELLLKIWTPYPFGLGLVRPTESDELYVHGLLIINRPTFYPQSFDCVYQPHLMNTPFIHKSLLRQMKHLK